MRRTLYWLRVVVTLAVGLFGPLPADEMPISQEFKESKTATANLYSQEVLANLDFIKHIFRTKYAPKEWKFQLVGWNLDDQIAKAKDKVLKADALTLDGGRQILLQFISSCCDYHVKAGFHSTAFSYLPFRIKSSQGRYFVSWVDEMLLWDLGIDLEVGDEVIAFDRRPIDDVVSELYEGYFNRGFPSTDRALAEISLTLRMGSEGLIPQQGGVPLIVLQHGRKVKRVLEWFYAPEEIAPPFAVQDYALKNLKKSDSQLALHSVFHKAMKTPLYQPFVDVYEKINRLRGHSQDIIDNDFFPMGNFKSYVPTLGQILWTPDYATTFNAYIFEHPRTKKQIGYIRIPSFDYQEGESPIEFAQLIEEFENSTDALVIDQVCNPGGDLLFAYTLASMLTTTPLTLPSHAFTITQKDVREALFYLEMLSYIDSEDSAKDVFGDTLSGYNVDMDLVAGIKNHFEFVIEQWNAGHHITDQFHLYGITEVKPHQFATYSKPLLMLIDNLDFSCADFLPAILQDNQRVTLFGARTGGAGGFVDQYTYPNLFGMSHFSCTASFAQRPGNIPLENLGATPDIPYEITPADLQYGYSSYSRAVNKALETIILP